MVRLLTVHEIADAAKLGPQFFAEGKLPGRFLPEVFISSWTSLINGGIGFILGLFEGERLSGVFGAVVVPDVNDGELSANEMFWFVSPDYRGHGMSLLRGYESECVKRGAKRCSMIHLLSLQPDKLKRIYTRMGFLPVETTYIKEL